MVNCYRSCFHVCLVGGRILVVVQQQLGMLLLLAYCFVPSNGDGQEVVHWTANVMSIFLFYFNFSRQPSLSQCPPMYRSHSVKKMYGTQICILLSQNLIGVCAGVSLCCRLVVNWLHFSTKIWIFSGNLQRFLSSFWSHFPALFHWNKMTLMIFRHLHHRRPRHLRAMTKLCGTTFSRLFPSSSL